MAQKQYPAPPSNASRQWPLRWIGRLVGFNVRNQEISLALSFFLLRARNRLS
jgi:hypothetical protein